MLCGGKEASDVYAVYGGCNFTDSGCNFTGCNFTDRLMVQVQVRLFCQKNTI